MKHLYTLAFCSLVFGVPFLAGAAYNDVTLETTAILDVGGYELTISGSSAVVESIEVGAADFTVTLQNGSSIAVASADRVDYAYDVAAQTTTETCTDSESTLTLSVASAGATTVVVTPSGTCTPAAEEEPSGGGGGTSYRKDLEDDEDNQDDSALKRQLLAQLKSLLEQFVTLGGVPTPEILALLGGSSDGVYARDLDLGMEGNDVLMLQNLLIAQNKGPAAQALAANGATGYFGPLTQAALAEFQAAVGITPAVGYFGPKTRAYVQGL